MADKQEEKNMAEETALRSMFTDYALETLFPDWTQHPEHAKSICMARLGCNTAHAQISGADTDVKDGITDGYGQPVNIRDVTVVTGADPDPTLVKVTVIVETQGEDDPLRGNTIREIGLFINNGTEPPDWRMVWLSDMPDMYIPRADESGGITVTSKITVPIKFSNAEQINLNTQNEGLAAKIGEVENTVNIMKGSGGATEKADKAITAQLINKLNSGGNPPSTDFPALSDVKKKADADMGIDGAADRLAAGYAVAYPLAVVGLIMTCILLRSLCRIDLIRRKQWHRWQTETQWQLR